MRPPCGKCVTNYLDVLFQPYAGGQLDIDISTHCPMHGHTSAGLGLVAAICAVMFVLACCVAAMSAISELMVFVAAVISRTLSLTAWHACKGATPPSTKHTNGQMVVRDPTLLSAGPLRRVGQKQEAAAVLLQLDVKSSKTRKQTCQRTFHFRAAEQVGLHRAKRYGFQCRSLEICFASTDLQWMVYFTFASKHENTGVQPLT